MIGGLNVEMKKRVFITGVSGFTGSYVSQAFETAGWEVWGLAQHLALPHERYVVCDLADTEAMKNAIRMAAPDVVIHLAGIAFVGHLDTCAFYDVNVAGTANLLDAVVNSGASPYNVILASSANVYGNSGDVCLHESSIFDPVNEYAVSKCAMEYVARLWRSRLPITVTRPFNYTGVGQSEKFLVPKIVRHFRDRCASIELGNIEIERDFSDVRDIAEMYLGLASIEGVNATFNLCSGKSLALSSILDLVSRLSGHKLEVMVNSAFVRPDDVRTLQGDDSYLRSAIGAVSRHTFEETLSWMLQSPS